MHKKWITLIILWLASMTLAQGAPDQVNAALQALSTQVGREITLTNNTLTNWQWGQATFDDASLGCPSDGEMYAQVITPGYIFILEYAGVVYEYHVSQDSANVRLCSQISSDEPTPTPPLDEQFSNPLCIPPTAESGAYARSFVRPEMPVVGTLAVNRLRQNPSTDAPIIAEIPNGAVFIVKTGPECDEEGIVWWQVDYDGITGYTAESLADERYIVPQPPNPLRQHATITTDNVGQVTQLSVIEANILTDIEWSQNMLLAVPAGLGANGVFVYSMSDLSQPFFIERDEIVTALDFIPNNQQVLVGTDAGSVHIWNIVTTVDTPFVESLFLQTHSADIRALTAHPATTIFASSGFNAAINNPNINRENAIVVANYETVAQERILEQSSPATHLAYSPDGTRLAVVEFNVNSGLLQLWDMANGNSINTASGVFRALDYSRNGQFIAVGGQDGTVLLFDGTTLNPVSTLTGHLREVVGVAFSPDSSLLASISPDGTLRLWNTQSDENVAVIELGDVGAADIAFAPDGSLIAVSIDPNKIFIYGIP